MKRSMDGQVVVITGASSGIARATAHRFAREGARLVLAARRAAELEDAAEECRTLGATAVTVVADVSAPEQVDHIAKVAVSQFGTINIWLNCAAVLQFGRIEDTPPAIIERVMQVNVLGYFYGAQAAIRQFRRQGRGHLMNVASVLGVTAQPYAAAYVASKFAVRGLSDTLRQELRQENNIHVSTVLPFAIDTPIYQRAANYTGRQMQPIAPRYAAEVVADTIFATALKPKHEVVAGKLGVAATLQKHLFPKTTEHLIGRAVEVMEFGNEPAQDSPGNLFSPPHDAYRVSGGWRHVGGRSNRTAITLLGLAGAVGVAVALRRRPAQLYGHGQRL